MPRIGLLFPVFAMTLLTLGLGAGLIAFRAGQSPPVALALSRWAEACQMGSAPSFALLDAEATRERALNPPGRFAAQYQLETGGLVTLSDMIIAFGPPHQVSCLQHSISGGRPIAWMRLVFNKGNIEAYMLLTEGASRLVPDTPISAMRYYAPGHQNLFQGMRGWQGLAAMAVYDDCLPRPRATPS